MQTDRRAILSLVALGRITPAEAERLLIVWNEQREGAVVFAACVVLALAAQINATGDLPALLHFARGLPAGAWLHDALTLFTRFMGGLQ
jgi:hypothetical protein